MSLVTPPELALLLVADSHVMIRRVLRCYAAAGDPSRLELVVAALRGADVTEAKLHAEGFRHARVIDGGGGDLAIAEARAARAATAPLVVFAQAHAYPMPGFVDTILNARRSGRWAVVGPRMECANPRSAMARASMRIGYGSWWGGGERGPTDMVAGHSSAYDRVALLSLGDDLEKLLPAGRQLQLELGARGGENFFEPAACVEIVNASERNAFVADQFRQGRLVGGERSIRWSAARRLAYAAGSPLIPTVRLARILAEVVRAGKPRLTASELPALVVGLVVSATGELVGYLFGKSTDSASQEISFHRLLYVREEDREGDGDEDRLACR